MNGLDAITAISASANRAMSPAIPSDFGFIFLLSCGFNSGMVGSEPARVVQRMHVLAVRESSDWQIS